MVADKQSTLHENWYSKSIFSIHYDTHISLKEVEAGAGARVAQIRKMLRLTKPDMVQFHAKGHPGYATYPTRAGTPSPHLKRDILSAFRKATRAEGVRFSIYFSTGLDGVTAREHPEWKRIGPRGKPQRMFCGEVLCFNSPYVTKNLLPMLTETVARYDPDAFWFDAEIWTVCPCWCAWCKAGFEREYGVSPPHSPRSRRWPEWLRFHRNSFVQYLNRCADHIRSLKKGCLFASNWAYTTSQPESVLAKVDWLSADAGVNRGRWRGSLEARHMMTKGLPFDLMAWDHVMDFSAITESCHPSQPKSAVHLMQEASFALAAGGRFFLWTNPRLDTSLREHEHKVIAQVSGFVRRRKRLVLGTEAVRDTAILYSETDFYRTGLRTTNSACFACGEGGASVSGAHYALTGAGHHTEIVNEETLMRNVGDYRVVVVPEPTVLSANVVAALREYVKSGGNLLVTGYPVEERDPKKNLILQDVLGVRDTGKRTGGFIRVRGRGFQIFCEGANVRLSGARVVSYLMKNEDVTAKKWPAAVLHATFGKGRAAYIPFNICTEYVNYRAPFVRDFISEVLERLSPERPVKISGSRTVEIFLRSKGNALLVHLINHAVGKEMEGTDWCVEEVPPCGPLTLNIRCGKRPTQVTLEPGRKTVEWTWQRGMLKVRVEKLHIHAVVMVAPWPG